MKVDVREAPLDVAEVIAEIARPEAGGIDVFVGVVRRESEGRAVETLEYSAYASMAKREMAAIAEAIEAEMPGVRVAAVHRVGLLRVGEAAIVCAASAPHRGEAFAACRALIDRIKATVPIWKREVGPDGATWVGWVDARCDPDHGHGHAHHAHQPPPGHHEP